MVMHWQSQARDMRRRGMRVVQIAEVLGLPPEKVKQGLTGEYVARPTRRETAPAPAPLPLYPRTPLEWREAWLRRICADHGVTLEDVRGPIRKQFLQPARRACCAFLRDDWGMSYPQIATYMNRDHSTVIYAVRRHKELTQ